MALHHVLTYEYVDDILEKRGPHREGHLAHATAARDRGRLRFLGALGEPVRSALGIFTPGVTPAEIEDFVRHDPYITAGLVTAWRIDPWDVAVAEEPSA